jgi:hypothetical protein
MKRLVLAIALLFTIAVAHAQTPAPRRITVNEKSIVKDSSGYQYPYVLWQKLTTSGDYWLKAIDPRKDDTEFILIKYTEEQKANRLSRMPRPADSKFFTTGEAHQAL